MQNLWGQITKTIRRFEVNPHFLNLIFGEWLGGESRPYIVSGKFKLPGTSFKIVYNTSNYKHGRRKLPFYILRHRMYVTIDDGNTLVFSELVDVDEATANDNGLAEKEARLIAEEYVQWRSRNLA